MIDLSLNLGDMKKLIEKSEKTFSNIYLPNIYPKLYLPNSGICSKEFILFIKRYFFDDFFPSGYTKTNVSTYELCADILFNALERGNCCNPNLPISIDGYKGNKGRILRVEDCGNGFDITEKMNKMKTGEKYFQRYGRGLKLFNAFEGKVNYEGKGNIINIMYFSQSNF